MGASQGTVHSVDLIEDFFVKATSDAAKPPLHDRLASLCSHICGCSVIAVWNWNIAVWN